MELKRNTKALFSCGKIAINTHWLLHVKNMPLTSQAEQLLSSAFLSFFFFPEVHQQQKEAEIKKTVPVDNKRMNEEKKSIADLLHSINYPST